MPIYLLHGFRWPRPLIRIHVIIQNLDDAAPEWLMAPTTAETLIENFRTLLPKAMQSLPDLLFIEQYEPADLQTSGQPFAYVADTVYRAGLSLKLSDYTLDVPKAKAKAIEDLRDKLIEKDSSKTEIGWYIVYCGDELRDWQSMPEARNSVETVRSSNPAKRSTSVTSATSAMLEANRPDYSVAGLSMAHNRPGVDRSTETSSQASSKSKEAGSISRGIKKLLRKKER